MCGSFNNVLISDYHFTISNIIDTEDLTQILIFPGKCRQNRESTAKLKYIGEDSKIHKSN